MNKFGKTGASLLTCSILLFVLLYFIGCGNDELLQSIWVEVLGVNFIASPTSGVARLTVNFTDTSSGEVTAWEWDFDNDGTIDSTEQNPTYRYHSPGTYSVRLRTRAHGANVDVVKQDLIQVTLGTPEKHTVTNSFEEVTSIGVADIDGDGDQDVIGGAEGATITLRWFRNDDGAGTLWSTNNTTVSSATNAYSVFAIDFDGDSDTDIVEAGDDGGADDTNWWENTNSLGTSWTEHGIGMAGGDKAVYAADLDNDGDMNAVSAGWGGDRITWFDYIGSSWNPHDITDNGNDEGCSWAKSLTAVHIDGDNLLDILAIGGGGIYWWKNMNNTNYWPRYPIADNYVSDWTIVYSVQAADIDGDGDNDAVSSSPGDWPNYDGELAWWENTAGDGSSWQRHPIDAEVNGASLYPADIDGDGDIDVLGVGSNYDFKLTPPEPTSSYIAWWENIDGLGTSWEEHTVETDTSYNRASAAWVADVDSDGDLDVLAAVPNYDYTIPSTPIPAGGYIAWWEILK
jgi:PKD repeat protein